MKSNLLQQRLGLLFLKGVGPIKARKLLNTLPDISLLYSGQFASLSRLTGISPKVLREMNRSEALACAESHLSNIHQYHDFDLFIQDAAYPRRLKQCEDAPLFLFQKGQFDLNAGHFVSIVGTRTPTSYGLEVTEEIIRSFQGRNITVISGLAYGIDIHVHRLCLKYGVPTVAVLGHGLDIIYPYAHKGVVHQMLDSAGAVLSEFLPKTEPDRENFPKRNRIVAGMSDAVIVIESKKKGGSMITANLGLDYNKEVFAVPGAISWPFSEGCNVLISTCRAQPFLSVEAFLETMNWKQASGDQEVTYTIEVKDEYRDLYQLLKDGPKHLDELIEKLTFTRSELSVALFEMEMEGNIRQLPGMYYGLTA